MTSVGRDFFIAAFEIIRSNTRSQGKQPQVVKNPVASRLLGRSVSEATVVRKHQGLDLTAWLGSGVEAELYRLRAGNDVLIVSFPISVDTQSVTNFARVKKMESKLLGSGLEIESKYSINALAALVYQPNGWADSKEWPEEWLVVPASKADAYLSQQIVTSLIAQLAVERSLLNWAVDSSKLRLWRPFRPAIRAFWIRNFDVQLLFDRSSILKSYEEVRRAQNFENVRSEILRRAASWWSLVGTLIAILAVYLSWTATQ